MGYTHYFNTKKEIPQDKWDAEVIPGIRAIIKTAAEPLFKIPIAGPLGEPDTEPDFGINYIRFNGLNDDSYETMSISRTRLDFYFCKTARQPYDAVCVAVAIFMETCFKSYFSWSSDGEGEPDYKTEGLHLLHETFEYDKLDRRTLIKCLKSIIETA